MKINIITKYQFSLISYDQYQPWKTIKFQPR